MVHARNYGTGSVVRVRSVADHCWLPAEIPEYSTVTFQALDRGGLLVEWEGKSCVVPMGCIDPSWAPVRPSCRWPGGSIRGAIRSLKTTSSRESTNSTHADRSSTEQQAAAGLAGNCAVAARLALLQAAERITDLGGCATLGRHGLASTKRSAARWGGCAHGCNCDLSGT